MIQPLTPEADLITRVKTEQDSEALNTLIGNHSGIYLSVVNRYASAYPNTIRRADLADDRAFNIYSFILDYNPERGTKLSTYIGDRTDWMCKGILKRDRRNPVRSGTYGPSGAMSLGTLGDTYTTDSGTDVTLVDEHPDMDVPAMVDKDLRIQDIMETAQRVCTDERFLSILAYRHFNTQGKTGLSWRQIGQKLGISHERARSIYNQNVELVKAELATKTI